MIKLISSHKLLAIFITGVIIRVSYLNHHDLWFDEAFSWILSKLPLNAIYTASLADNHPPLYFIILHFWIAVFGNNILVLRGLSLFFGLISLYLFIKLAYKYFERSALISSLIFSVSPLIAYYSAETRMYSLVLMLTIASTYIWLSLIKNPSKIFLIVFYILFTCAFYTHYYSILLLIPYLFIALINKRKDMILILIIFIISATPLIKMYFDFQHPQKVTSNPILALPISLATFVLGGTGVVSIRNYFLIANNQILFVLISSLTLISIFITFIKGAYYSIVNSKNIEFILLLFLPLATIFLIGFFVPIFSVRSVIIFAPFFYLFCGQGIYQLFGSNNSKYIFIIFVSFTLLNLSILNYSNLRGINIINSVKFLPNNSNVLHSSILTYYSFLYYAKQFNNYLVLPNPLSLETTQLIGGTSTSPDIVQANSYFIQVENGADEYLESEYKRKLMSNHILSLVYNKGGILIFKVE